MSLWVRNVRGTAPRICVWQMPIKVCAALSPLPPSSSLSRWYHYQAIVTPDPGTRSLTLFLYSDVYTHGTPTTNDYSDVVVRRSPVVLQPVVVATPRSHEPPAPALYTFGETFSPDWIAPPGDQHVEVDGLTQRLARTTRRGRFAALRPVIVVFAVALCLASRRWFLLALALPRWPGHRD